MLESRTHMYLKATIQKHLNYMKYLEKQLGKTTHEMDIFRIKNDLRSEEIIINWLRKKLQKLAY
jgi:hypothetical protein